MTNPKRYYPRGPEGIEMVEDPIGAYVRIEDYARLMHDIEAGANEIKRLAAENAHLASLGGAALTQLHSAVEPTAHPVEPFVVKHYAADLRPIIKGNGFDGLEVGIERADAQDFVDWINARLGVNRNGDV